MIIRAKVVWENTITIDVSDDLPADIAKAEVNIYARASYNSNDIKIIHCHERPDIVDKAEG